jgi:hypothetical protein
MVAPVVFYGSARPSWSGRIATGEIEEIPKAKSGRGALFLNLAVALLVRFPADSALNQA